MSFPEWTESSRSNPQASSAGEGAEHFQQFVPAIPIAEHGDTAADGDASIKSLRALRDWPERITDWLEIHPRASLIVFSILYLLGTGFIASRRYLWNDEVVTAYVNRLPLSQLWPALTSGLDIEPPLFHLITRGFTSLFGQSALALRMPAILGGWLLCISLYLFVSRRFRHVYAAVAMLIPFVTGVAPYTYEARSYGIAWGLSGIALVCWQRGTEGRRRRPYYLAGLALSLAAAISCHYYILLVLLAISLAEALRAFLKRHIDWPMWGALGASVLPLFIFLPLIDAAMTFRGGAWSQASFLALFYAYQGFLLPAALPMALVVMGLALCGPTTALAATAPKNTRKGTLLPWETLAVVALVATLAGAFVLARCTNGIFAPRYGFCLILGVAILPAPVLRLYDRQRPLAGALALLVLVAAFLGHRAIPHQARFHTPDLLLKANRSSAIVIENPLNFLELTYNAPAQLTSRIYYLVSPEESVRYTGTDDDERGLLLLRHWFPIHAEAPDQFLQHHHRFLLWRGDKGQRWLLRKLRDDNSTIILSGTSDQESLFTVMLGSGAL